MREISCISNDFAPKHDLSVWSDMLLSSGAELIDCPAGTVLCRGGEKCGFIYYLVRGLVKVSVGKDESAARLLGYHIPNSLFPTDCLRTNTVQNATVEALTTLTILRFTPALLMDLCRKNAAFATDLALYVSDVLHHTCVNLENARADDAMRRMARFLRLYLQNSRLPGDILCIPMTQEALAQAISISRIQAVRVFTQLKEMGVVSIGRKRVMVLDEKRLSELADIA